ncbi:hypothetical protein ACTID9_10050 [Brevibacillus fluminis]|uniref:hypothetical protein n=1 Tax=Brevibacillus fluminis TaxID=511487 RepID=UPI003F8A032B
MKHLYGSSAEKNVKGKRSDGKIQRMKVAVTSLSPDVLVKLVKGAPKVYSRRTFAIRRALAKSRHPFITSAVIEKHLTTKVVTSVFEPREFPAALDFGALTAPKRIEVSEPVTREPLTDERVKSIVKRFWEGYLADGLPPIEAADSLISEVLGSSRLKGKESLIYEYVAELYFNTPDYDDVYYENLRIQADELKEQNPD